jgi:Arm DNA-binding domain
MSLSQFAINNAKPQDKPYLLSDDDGLHLRIHPKGGRQWRLRFRFGGKANMMSLGPSAEKTGQGKRATRGRNRSVAQQEDRKANHRRRGSKIPSARWQTNTLPT